MRPIEPGALCLAFDPEQDGAQECVAVRFVEKGGDYDDCYTAKVDTWVVDRELKLIDKRINYGLDSVDARFIMRIDGHEEPAKQREAEAV